MQYGRVFSGRSKKNTETESAAMVTVRNRCQSRIKKHLKGLDGGGQGTVGNLIDATDRQLISKVLLEGRVYKTWYGGRIVLLGDVMLVSSATVLVEGRDAVV